MNIFHVTLKSATTKNVTFLKVAPETKFVSLARLTAKTEDKLENNYAFTIGKKTNVAHFWGLKNVNKT